MKFKVLFKADNVQKLIKDLEKEFKVKSVGARAGYLSGKQHESKNGTKGAFLSEIALWNEFGTDTIPSRPFLRNASRNIKKRGRKILEAGIQDEKSLNAIMNEIAQDMVNQIKESISDNTPPPNAPATIRKKKSSRTLIDTGNLRDSVHAGIIKKGVERLIKE